MLCSGVVPWKGGVVPWNDAALSKAVTNAVQGTVLTHSLLMHTREDSRVFEQSEANCGDLVMGYFQFNAHWCCSVS